jgi:hypothetical protein
MCVLNANACGRIGMKITTGKETLRKFGVQC